MDVLICNGFDIYLGMNTLNSLSVKPYRWRGIWKSSATEHALQNKAAKIVKGHWTLSLVDLPAI